MKKIAIDPITRLEGHGKITIFLTDEGEVANVYFQIPELRGFERFAEGRPVEELPHITPRICGVCPEAHHMASAKAVDAVFHVDPPPTAKKLRELLYSAFFVEDHTLHFYYLGGPDFLTAPDAPVAERNILGVIKKVGLEIGGKVIELRKRCNRVIEILAGRQCHPICNLPGGVSKGINEEERKEIEETAHWSIEFALFSLDAFKKLVLGNPKYKDLILGDIYYHETHSMGLVDENNKVNFYDGKVRVVDTKGNELCKYAPAEYMEYVAEHVEPWTFLKFPFLKKIGWKGLVDGQDSGIYRATPQSRLNASDGMATPKAQEAYEEYYETLTGDRSGKKPVHHTLAIHWARLIEILYSAERMLELIKDPEIMGTNLRTIPTETPTEGVGIVEAPRGTLTHHYITDEKGIVKRANLIVGTTNNYGALNLSVKKAAQSLIKKGKEITEPILNMIEMAFRAYDPCFACATHSLPGKMPLIVEVRDTDGNLLKTIKRD